MKQKLTIIIAVCLFITLVFQPCSVKKAEVAVSLTSTKTAVKHTKTPVSKHGRLKVKGTKLVDKNGKAVQLQGVSSHGINWDVGEPFVNEAALKTLRDKWGANCFRIAMYTEDYNGYCVTDAANRKKLLKTIDIAVKAGKKLGMYVIIDWHVLNDQTPKKHQKAAKAFFKTVSKKYKSYNHVLYEICNEPNGSATWSAIKSYAKAIIPVIRKNSKTAIIIVGTPNWSQDVDVASKSPLKGYSNIMYAVHFYAATHKDSYRQKLQTAIKNKLPVICTEFSACEASGNGAYDFTSAKKWINMLKKNKIGYVCWSLSNKPESASLLKPSCKRTGGFTNSDLSKMGKWLISVY
ncbi:MAG: glycoside hydrolase family 5 protein [Firmicutes bacterium]|nr:glycoside hydrolase family 5 protein [Bacillota bacterium]